MASFGLEADAALRAWRAIVHSLDVGGEPVPRPKASKPCWPARMSACRRRRPACEMSTVLDSLYAHFEREAGRGKDTTKERTR
jgi:hypothetical protein